MKTKAPALFVLALALAFAGCSTAPTVPMSRVKAALKARPDPKLPPLPPGYKAPSIYAQRAAARRQATLAPAAAYVPGSPPMELLDWIDPDTYLVRVLQQSNTVVRIKQTETLGGELQEIAVFECSMQPEAQWVATTVARNRPQLFVAGSNEQCLPVTTLAVRAGPILGTGRTVKSKDGRKWYVLKLPKTGAGGRSLYWLKPVPPKK